MKWWQRITEVFGGSKAAENAVKRAADGIYYGLDKAFYTQEEKAEDRAERFKMLYDFVAKTFDENSLRNVTRRWLAWGVTFWLLVNAQLAIYYGLTGDVENVKLIIDVVKSFWIGEAFTGIMVAYFGVQFVRGKAK